MAKKRVKKCSMNVGMRVRGPYSRSCPKSKTLPKVRGYKPSKEKCAFLARHGIHPVACTGVKVKRVRRRRKG